MLEADLAFRTQLVIPEQRTLYDYWVKCRGTRTMPARRDIEPGGFRRHLSFVSLIDVETDPQKRFRVRLAGSGLREIYGQELTGKYLDQIPHIKCAPCHRMVEKGKPAQGIHALHTVNDEHLIQFWLKLPLSADGNAVTMILGYDVFLQAAQAVALTQALSPAAKAS